MVLLPLLLWAFCSVQRCTAQDAGGGVASPVTLTSSDDGDDYTDEILIGFAIVVVSILVILGVRADRRFSEADDSLEYVQADERDIEWTGTSLRARF